MMTKRRQKGFLTIILLSTCLIYLNWLVNINDWVVLTSKTKQTMSKNINKLKEETAKINELVEKYGENININFKNKYMLMAVREGEVELEEEENAAVTRQIKDKSDNRSELNFIFNVVYRHKAFLIDANLLGDLKVSGVELLPDFKNKIGTFKRLEASEPLLVAFGISLEAFEILNKV